MRLPSSPSDGFISSDHTDSRFVFSDTLNQWTNIGQVASDGIVSHHKNGFISPEIASILYVLNDTKPINFKLIDAPLSYYYMIDTGSPSVILTNVENNNIRMEINRHALATLLQCSVCPGGKGKKGLDGRAGVDGLPGPKEIDFIVDVKSNVLSISAPVQTPLDTNISLRLFKNGEKKSEIYVEPNSGDWEVISSDIEINDDSKIAHHNGILEATIYTSDEWGDGWFARARQIGPKGRDGVNGDNFISLQESDLYGLKSVEAIVSLRRSKDRNLFYVKQSIGDMPVSSLRPHSSRSGDTAREIDLTGRHNSKFVAVEPAIDNNKKLNRWEMSAELGTQAPVSLPEWVPNCSCTADVFYDWSSQFEGTTNEVPIEFENQPSLPVKCCQEDFYFCPNLGDACEIESGGPWEWPPAAPPTGKAPDWNVWERPGRWLPL